MMATHKNIGFTDPRGDWRKLIRMTLQSPELLTKTLPPTARAAMVPFTRDVKRTARNKWPKEIYFKSLANRNPKPAFLWGVKTRVPKKKWHPKGQWRMQFRPSNAGASVLMEFGSYKRPYRYPKHGIFLSFKGRKDGKWVHVKKTKSTRPKPVWRNAWARLKARGVRNVQELLLQNAAATVYNSMTKGGFATGAFVIK